MKIYVVKNQDLEMLQFIKLACGYSLEIAEGISYERAINSCMEEVYVGGKTIGKKSYFRNHLLLNILLLMKVTSFFSLTN